MTDDYTRTSNQSVGWFRSRVDEGTLEKRPPFQRNFVWSARQQSSLIETILLRYPIPELYMQEGLDAAEQEQYVLVDGQQRVTTCLEFVADEFALDTSVDPRWSGSTFSGLTPEERRRVLQYQFVVRTLPAEWSEERLRDVFARLNRGVSALEDQELRHATYWGPFIKCMEELAKDEQWTDLRVFTANDIRRMADVEFISELVIANLHGFLNKKDDLDDYYLLYETGFDQEVDVKKTFKKVLPVMVDLAETMATKRWRKKSDFYTLFHLLASDVRRWCSANVRPALAVLLDEFADGVDTTLSRLGREVAAVVAGGDTTGDVLKQVPEEVSIYTLAVRGAASDLAARRARCEALEAYLDQRLTPSFIRDAASAAAQRAAEEQETAAKKSAKGAAGKKPSPIKTAAAKKTTAKKTTAKKGTVRKSTDKRSAATNG